MQLKFKYTYYVAPRTLFTWINCTLLYLLSKRVTYDEHRNPKKPKFGYSVSIQYVKNKQMVCWFPKYIDQNREHKFFDCSICYVGVTSSESDDTKGFQVAAANLSRDQVGRGRHRGEASR